MDGNLELDLKVELKELCQRSAELTKSLKGAEEKLLIAEKEVIRLQRLNVITNDYNEDLRRQLETLNSNLHEFKTSTNRDHLETAAVKTFSDASTEYEEQDKGGEVGGDVGVSVGPAAAGVSRLIPEQHSLDMAEPSTGDADGTAENSIKSMMEGIRETSEMTVARSGFVYDSRTQMYYDCQSGYYYDAEKGLYYDPYSGCYYYYDYNAQSYQFHSQLDPATFSTISHLIFSQNDDTAADNILEELQPITPADKKLVIKKKKQQKPVRKKCGIRLRQLGDLNTTDDTDENTWTREKRMSRKREGQRLMEKMKESLPVYLNELCTKLQRRTAFSKSSKQRPEKLRGAVMETSVLHDGILQGIGHEVDGRPTEDENGIDANGGSSEDSAAGSEADASESESELEDGEVVESSADFESDDSEVFQSCPEDNASMDPQSKPEMIRCTPCIRVIVKNSDYLPVGKLYIVTCTAEATIGRDETLSHTIHIADPLVSKVHSGIKYSEELQRYTIQDYASQCGTYVNGRRLSDVKVLSVPCPLYNGDVVRISETVLEMHIHPGHNTCMSCEPGNLTPLPPSSAHKVTNIVSKEEKEQERRKQLKAMRKKYGLQKMDFEVNGHPFASAKYQDKAAERRAAVGSDNPHQKDDLPSSVFRELSSDNVGHKLLSKMGWNPGMGIGKTNQGIKDPVQVSLRMNHSAGLGSENQLLSPDDVVQVHSSQKWVKAQQRYNQMRTKGDQYVAPISDGRLPDGKGDLNSIKINILPSGNGNGSIEKRVWVKGDDI